AGLAGALRPRRQGARPREHHRRGRTDGLLHGRLADDERLRRAGRHAGPGPLREVMTALKITPLHPSLGAEISGLDLSRPNDAPTREAPSRAPARPLARGFPARRAPP